MESNAPPLIAPPSPAPTPALTAPASASEARALLRALIRLKWAAGFASALAVFSLAGLFLTYQRFSTLRPIVLVGGQRITLRDYEGALERRDNGKVLHDMVSAALVRQAAAEDGSLPLLRDQLLDQIALENLRIRNVPVSDAEVDRYYQAHRASFQQRAQAQMALVVADTAEEADAAADDLRDGIPLDVIAEQKGLYVAGEKGYRVSLGTPQGRTLAESWKTMRRGETRTAPLGRQFLVAQMVSVEGAGTLPLQTVRASVARLARLEKTIPAEAALARLYRATPPSFPVDKYAGYFDAGARAGR